MKIVRGLMTLGAALCVPAVLGAQQRVRPEGSAHAGIATRAEPNAAVPADTTSSSTRVSVYAPSRNKSASAYQSLRNTENSLAQRVRAEAPPPAAQSTARLPHDSTLSRAPAPAGQGTFGASKRSHTLSRAPALPGTATQNAAGRSAVAQYDAMAPGIWAVNRKQRDFLITPGGYLTVSGKGFGDTVGQANVIGDFPGGAAPLRTVDWRDNEVYLLLPEGLRGVRDQQATLQIITRAGKTFRLDGGRFVAEREEVTLTSNLSRLVRVETAGIWPAELDSNAAVVRYAHRGAVRCSDPSTDYLSFAQPAKDFEVVGISMVAVAPRTSTNDPTVVHWYLPGYSFGAWADRLPANWGVWKFSNRFQEDWTCESGYRIDSVTLYGPAGVAPL